MSMLGLLAGLGDAAGKELDRRDRDSQAKRAAFADDLRRIMESEDWPEQARVAAANVRYRLFSDPKVKAKDYEKMWQEVHAASGRPGQQSQEVAAAKSDIPAMQSLRGNLATASAGVPQAKPDGLTMRAPSPLDILGAPPDPVVGAQGSQFLNLSPDVQTDNLVAPRNLFGAVGNRLEQNQNIVNAAPPVAAVYGPRTRAEKNMEAMELFKQQQGLQNEQYLWQKGVDSAFAKPQESWKFDTKRGVLVNELTGEIKVPEGLPAAPPSGSGPNGDMTPEELFHDSSLRAAEQAGLNIKDPNTFQNVLGKSKAKWAELSRDPDSDFWKGQSITQQQDWRRFQSDQATVRNAEQLKNDYNKSRDQASASIRYAQSLKEAVRQASLGGDLAVIFSAMRALDPGSVVREQEYRVGQSLGGPFYTLLGKMNQLSGRGILAQKVRNEFDSLADMMIQMANADYQRINDLYMGVADARGIPPSMVGFSGPSTYVQGTVPPAIGGYNPRSLSGPPGTGSAVNKPQATNNQPSQFEQLILKALSGN